MDRLTRGEVWTIAPADHPKPRPALVVSINAINDLCPDVILVPITTRPGPLRVALTSGDATGLAEKSYAKCESVGPVRRDRLKRRIGRLPSDEMRAVEEGLARVLGLELARG